jgi:hypothetical protein
MPSASHNLLCYGDLQCGENCNRYIEKNNIAPKACQHSSSSRETIDPSTHVMLSTAVTIYEVQCAEHSPKIFSDGV